MAKLKGYKKPFSSFFTEWSKEEQAKFIERETKNIIKRLPRLKSALQMYEEISDELYNLSPSEIELIGTTYARAVRSGEISTPSSQRAYQKFIGNLRKYSRTSIRELAVRTAEERMSSWLDSVRSHGSEEEIAYAEELVEGMTEGQKIGFTKSKYFLDVENWGSEGFIQSTSEGEYSIQTLKLELYLQQYEDKETRNIYNEYVASDNDTNALRGYARGRKGKIKKGK